MTWAKRGALSLLALAWSGCCAPEVVPTPLPRPPLPGGRPPDRTAQLEALAAGWAFPGPGPDGVWATPDDEHPELFGSDGAGGTIDDEARMPVVDLEDVLADRAELRAWVAALEAAGWPR